MDIVGGVGAIVGIIDVVTRIVLVLRDVKSRLEEADTTLMALIGELTTIKAALNQVKALIESRANEEMHHQLVMDLDDTLGCCLTLVNVVDDRVMQLNWHDGANLRPVFRAKVKLVLNSQDMTGSLQSLSRILTAVNTLILAYNSQSTEAQNGVLQIPENWKMFDRIKDDSSSLIALYDQSTNGSRRSFVTVATSTLSLRLPGLDRVLLQSPVYNHLLDRLLERKRSAKHQNVSPKEPPEVHVTNTQMHLVSDSHQMKVLENARIIITGHRQGCQKVGNVMRCDLARNVGLRVGSEGRWTGILDWSLNDGLTNSEAVLDEPSNPQKSGDAQDLLRACGKRDISTLLYVIDMSHYVWLGWQHAGQGERMLEEDVKILRSLYTSPCLREAAFVVVLLESDVYNETNIWLGPYRFLSGYTGNVLTKLKKYLIRDWQATLIKESRPSRDTIQFIEGPVEGLPGKISSILMAIINQWDQ